MIDIEALKREARLEGENASVSRRWLRQVADELEAGRQAQDELKRIDKHIGDTFGLPGFSL